MKLIDEDTIAHHYSPTGIFCDTQRFLSQSHWHDADIADGASAPPVVKIGYLDNVAASYRIRLDAEPPRYVTLVTVRPDRPLLVASTYLTYQRTAALLLSAPWLARSHGRRVLVVGAGRLGSAIAKMAAGIFTESSVSVFSRRPRPAITRSGARIVSTISATDRFDIVVTATNSKLPLTSELPLAHARWLVVGGSSRNAVEIRNVPLKPRRQYSDSPLNAKFRGLLDHPDSLPRPTAATVPDVPSVVIVCGGGGVDGYLAECCWNRLKDLVK